MKELNIIKKEILTVRQNTNSFTVKNSADLDTGAEILKMIKNTVDIITQRKDEITRPLMTELAKTRDLFKPLELDLEGAKKEVKAKMLAFQIEEEERIAKDKARIDARVAKGTMRTDTAIEKIDKLGEAPKSNIRTLIKVRITDETAIPREYLVPDMMKITEAVLKQNIYIPGVETYKEKQIVTR